MADEVNVTVTEDGADVVVVPGEGGPRGATGDPGPPPPRPPRSRRAK